MAEAPSGTVTFLFTDIEGSTRRWQDEPETMRLLLQEHDAILHEAIDKHRGALFKHTGDGVAAAFPSAADACAAAVEAQARLAGVLPVRMGLHTGEAELRDGDYFGSTLNRCARLMGIAHGGQIVCSEATAALVRDRDDLRDLGEHRLRDLSRAERVWQVGGGEFAALRSLDTARTNLPVQPTALIGRQALIAELAALVEHQPVVTLSGVGGVGKTRLALEVGAELLPRFADGVWLVELAPLAHDELVLATIAEVLGVRAQQGEPLATTLTNRIKAKRLLVIVDNCEHVIGAVARLAEQVVAAAPGVRILATSREPLGIAAERVRAVPPLAEGTEAVELFLDRATQAGAVFDDTQLRAIGEICTRLDGIPLAIELAAARARMMAPFQIAERLDQRFRLLTGGGRTAVERHRTLQATVSWSYELLDETERLVFQRLSTMAGSFDLAAAEAIAAGDTVEGFEVLDALGHLVDKSMVIATVAPKGVRYRLLETLRQYGADRLAERPDAADVHDRHAFYWRDRAIALGRSLDNVGHQPIFDDIDADIDNYRRALAYLMATRRVDDAARGIVSFDIYWMARRNREGLGWNRQVLAHGDLDIALRLGALATAAHAEYLVGDARAGERDATEAVERADAAGLDPPWSALHVLMMVAPDPATYRHWYERAHRVATAEGKQHHVLLTEAMRGGLPDSDDTAELIAHYERLEPEIRRTGDPILICVCAMGFVVVLQADGQLERARVLAHHAIEPSRRSGRVTLVAALATLAAIDLFLGDADTARPSLSEGLRVCRGLPIQVIQCAYVAAIFAAECNEIEAAVTLLAAARHHEDRFGVKAGGMMFPTILTHAEAAIDTRSGDLGAARRRGAAMTLDELTAFALEIIA